MTFAASSGLGSPVLTHASASATSAESHGSTIRLVESSTPTCELLQASLSTTNTGFSTPISFRKLPMSSQESAQLPHTTDITQQEWTPKSSLSFRFKEKHNPQTPPTRSRVRTAPLDAKQQTSVLEGERDRDTDSLLSLTPSMNGKNFANWLSGLLGR